MESGKMVQTKHEHTWAGCDDMVFVEGENNGSSADVFCIDYNCEYGAFTDEHGNVIPHSIAKVGLHED